MYELTTYRIGVKQKRIWSPRLDAYYGTVCFYCKDKFIDEQHTIQGMTNPLIMEYDHLNDAEYDNRIENIVKAHKQCKTIHCLYLFKIVYLTNKKNQIFVIVLA